MAPLRLPRLPFELIESGVEDERGHVHDRAAFESFRPLPRGLAGVTSCRQESEPRGMRDASPSGFARPGSPACRARARRCG
jgi:hypothetical protein